LKNSETRNRAIEKINFTYKMIIDQMVHDALYYIPVLEALYNDYKEQTTLVQQTYNIGYPAIKHVKQIEMEVKDLTVVMRNEENECFEEINRNRQILRQHPKLVKGFVRRDVSI
jgi:vacuolar-type H+-ATPase subunit C/Vma6